MKTSAMMKDALISIVQNRSDTWRTKYQPADSTAGFFVQQQQSTEKSLKNR
jgi:hypothetical protein